MTPLAHANDTGSRSVATGTFPGFWFWSRVRAHFARLERATARQERFARLNGEEARDLGLQPEDVMGDSAYDAALPFFLQAGFQQR